MNKQGLSEERLFEKLVEQIDRVAALEARVNVCKTFGLFDVAQKAAVEKNLAVKRAQSLRRAVYPETYGMVAEEKDHE